MPQKLPPEAIATQLKKIPDWETNEGHLVRTFEFDEYMDGIDFVNGVAEIAEEANHHPDIRIGYCKVNLSLVTHDCQALTDLDFELAKRLDTLVD